MSEYEMTLNSPMTHDDWAKITDANMEHTKSVTFQTEGGKCVEFVKVVRCKDCKYYQTDDVKCPCNIGLENPVPDAEYTWVPEPDWFCADGERREKDADGA